MAEPADKIAGSLGQLGAEIPPLSTGPQTEAGAANEESLNEFPCSIAQERFWLLDRLEPGNSSYNVAVRWRLEGRVDTALLEKTWLRIIDRHEILRTVFHEVNGSPVQRVTADGQFRLQEIDLSNIAAENQQAEADRIGLIEARAPFDVAAGPLLRVTLLRYSATVSVILVTTHQIVSDGWSIGVMSREMGVIYQALSRNLPEPLEPLAIQYADFTLWQIEWLKAHGSDAETKYWTAQLAGLKPFKVLADRPRPAIPTTSGAIASRVLPRELTNRAQALTAECGTTLFAAAIGSLCAMLARFTGNNEIVLGTQVSDRDQVELEPMVGQFVNSLVLRNNLAGDPTFREILRRASDTSTQALEHRHIPIEKLLGMIKGEHSHSNSPPISVNFIFQKTFIQNTVYADFALTDMPSLPVGAIYDLNFFMVERPDGWRFSCQYNTDQFESATADRMLGYIQGLMQYAVTHPDARLSEMPLGAPGEARLLFAKLNDKRTLYPRELTLSKLFQAQVMRAPLALALRFGSRELSYGDLDAAVTRFAHYLIKSGVQPGARIGVRLPMSADLPICLLGVLRAGATYVPMEPLDPPRRLDTLAAAAQIAFMVARGIDRTAKSPGSEKLLAVEEALAYVPEKNLALPDLAVEADVIAVLAFTAGGFDAEHAVGLSHRNLANQVYSLAKRPGVGERDVLLADPAALACQSLSEMLLSLLTGAQLVIPEPRDLSSDRARLRLLQRSGVSVLFGSAKSWSNLLRAGWIGSPALKMLCPWADLNLRLADQLSSMDGELWALYGAPEIAAWYAVQRIKPHQPLAQVGEPIANTSMYVLDSRMQIAGVGATGDLYIGGDGVAERAHVLADPFSTAPGARLLRSGALARLRANGLVELLGPTASFLHGQREVRPEEIEELLRRDPEILDAGVFQQVGQTGDRNIIAHIVLRRSSVEIDAATAERIRQRLAEVLPAALLPSAFVAHASLPRNAAGELDRQALPRQRAPVKNDATKPSLAAGTVESRLRELWASMLKLPSISVDDNFFEMGGHSLMAARMLTQVEQLFGRRIPLATLFTAPSIRELAAVLAQRSGRTLDFRQMVKLQPNGSKVPLIAINNTGNYYLLAKYLGPDQPFISLQLFDPSTRGAQMPLTLQELATEYVHLIQRVQPRGPYNLMGWCVAGALSFEIARQLTLANETVSNLLLMDSWVPRYIPRQPFLRRIVADYSLRLEMTWADWRRTLSGEQSVTKFIKNRVTAQKLNRWWARWSGQEHKLDNNETAQQTSEDYDRWLLNYLQGLTNQYEPGTYAGRVTLFRSEKEPTGLFFDPHAGWDQFATAGVKLFKVPGDHFTMFQNKGALQMAENITAIFEQR